MKSSRLTITITCLTVVLAGLGARAETTSREIAEQAAKEVAIQNLASWNIAFNAGGLDQINDLYAEDAIVVTPYGEPVSREGIRDFWHTVYGVGINTHALDVTAVEGSDDQVVVTSQWEALRSPENNVVFEGRMTSVLEKQSDGRWRTTYQRWQ